MTRRRSAGEWSRDPSGGALGRGQHERLERLTATRRAFASGERLGQLGSGSRRPTARTTSGVSAVSRSNSWRAGVGVEPAHRVDAAPVGLGLDAQRGDGLTGVEQGPRAGPAGVVDGLRGHQDERTRGVRPAAVAR